MTTLWQTGTTIARRMRVRGGGLDPTLTQLHMARLLTATDMQPAGLAPSAIVCIRTLHAPRHVPLALQHGLVRPSHAWQQAMHATLEESIRHAARPLLEPVPANSEAVIFNDTAELLACMTSDWSTGLLPTRWWWQSLFKSNDVASMLLPTWLNAPAYAPTALQHLAARNLVIPFVSSLRNEHARLLLQNIVQTFALHALYQILYGTQNDSDLQVGHPQGDAPTMRRGLVVMVGASPCGCPPLQSRLSRLVNDPDHSMDADPAHSMNADPAVGAQSIAPVTAPTSHQPVAPWQSIVPEAAHPAIHTSSASHIEQQCLLGIGLMLHRAPTLIRTTTFAQAVQNWLNATYTAEVSDTRHSSISADEDKPVYANNAATVQQTALSHDTRQIIADTPEQPQNDAVALAEEIPSQPEIHIDTAFGGLFYLINLALFLNLYSDFTTPTNTGIELPIWDFIALLGQHLLGDAIEQDPLWPLLAQLAARDEQDAPGKDFMPLDEWYAPAEWIVALPVEAIQQLEQPSMLSYILIRLQLALGLDSAEHVAPLLCVHAAHVRVTATQLDIFFSLHTLPIEIRLAGLDRNPGWVPAAGRFIAFHFS